MDSLHIVCPHCHSTNRLPAERLGAAAKCGRCHQSLFNAKPVALDQAQFQKHLVNNDIPMLVDFWAPWCGPCKMMAPIFEQATAQLEPHCRVAKVDTEAQQGLAMQYQIRSIPTLAIFKQGREVARQSGAMDLNALIAWTRQHL